MQTLSDIIRIDFDGIIIDYKVDYNITGKVFKAHPLIFDLPENGQKLILGGNQEDVRKKIKAFQDLITLIIPIGIQNQQTFFTKELSAIYSTINTQLQKEQIDLSLLYEYSESDSLEYYIHSSYSKPDEYPENFHKIWINAIEVINNRNSDVKSDNLSFLGYYYPQFGFKIIPLIIPFIKHSNTKRIAYENLDSYISEESLNYLIKELNTCKDGQALSGIFKSLSKHPLKDLKIQKDLIRIYRSEINLSEDAKANIMEALQHYPNNESFAIGMEILTENNRHSSGRASKMLLNMGYPAKKIADIMIPKLIASDPKDSEAAFSILCNSDEFKPYLPESSELLKIYVNTLEVGQNLNIAYSMPSMMRHNYDNSTSNDIVNYLSNSNPNVIEGLLILISIFVDEAGVDTKVFFSKKAKYRYMEFLNHEQSKVVENALRVMQKIGRRESNESYIDLFLDKIDFESNSLNNLYAMRAINYLLPAVKFNNRIVEYYKVALESTNYNYRVAALRGLRFSNDQNLKRSLNYLKDDPSDDVLRELELLFKAPSRFSKPSFLEKFLEYFKAKKKVKVATEGEAFMYYLKKRVAEGTRTQNEMIEKYRLK